MLDAKIQIDPIPYLLFTACVIYLMSKNKKTEVKRPAFEPNQVVVGDSRLLCKSLDDQSLATTITSPPYFDLKDYGSPDQIGFGQTYERYLDDLKQVFAEVHRATKPDGSLWIIIDTFRKDHEVLLLPFDLARHLKEVGWLLRDIVVWKKDRTLPWSHPGTTRKIFEYILVFSKGRGEFRFDPDAHRSISDLKKWWVKYPERYNPRGKSLEEVWTYDIPTQGSWGAEYIRHFCPLPEDLVARIIQITTNSDDVIFDPFAGSGTVPTISAKLGRKYLGFELNESYVEMFQKHLAKQLKKSPEKEAASVQLSVQDFEATVLKLRVLKFGRLLVRVLEKLDVPIDRIRVFAFESTEQPTEKQKICCAKYVISGPKTILTPSILKSIREQSQRPPLSKFGIQATIEQRPTDFDVSALSESDTLFAYTKTNSHIYRSEHRIADIALATCPLLSPIGVKVEEPIE